MTELELEATNVTINVIKTNLVVEHAVTANELIVDSLQALQFETLKEINRQIKALKAEAEILIDGFKESLGDKEKLLDSRGYELATYNHVAQRDSLNAKALKLNFYDVWSACTTKVDGTRSFKPKA